MYGLYTAFNQFLQFFYKFLQFLTNFYQFFTNFYSFLPTFTAFLQMFAPFCQFLWLKRLLPTLTNFMAVNLLTFAAINFNLLQFYSYKSPKNICLIAINLPTFTGLKIGKSVKVCKILSTTMLQRLTL